MGEAFLNNVHNITYSLRKSQIIELGPSDDVIVIFFQSSLYVNCAYVLRNAESINLFFF